MRHYKRYRRLGDPAAEVNTWTRRGSSCSVQDCDSAVLARGLCVKHYGRQRRHGTTDQRVMPSVEERFWAKVDRRGPTDCWPWIGAISSAGYGWFWDGHKGWNAHRYAYTVLVGPIPTGLTIDHLCFNPPCVNPAHLEPITNGENIRRAWARRYTTP